MNIYKKVICVTLLVIPILSGCSKNKKDDFDYEWVVNEDETKNKNEEESFLFPWKNGLEISILPPEWMSYYYDSKDYSNIEYYYAQGKETTAPKNPTLRWEYDDEACSDFTILLSKYKNMQESLSFSSENKSYELKCLFAGTTYYYQIKANYDDKYIISKRMSFKTVDFFRTIKIDGVCNARDLGNKKTINGKKVKQGLVYRSGNLDEVTSLGISQAQELNIKTDLDLREQGPTSSPLGENVNYINNGFGRYGSPFYVSSSSGVNVAAYQKPMLENLRLFANKDNLPLVFHCAVGRDRTGTLAVTLLLLLKVDLEQIKQDYAVSFFSKLCNNDSFTSYESLMNVLFYFFEYYIGNDNSDNGDIYQRTEEYCLDIGVSKQEINSIRNNLLE